MMKEDLLESYDLVADFVPVKVRIVRRDMEFVPLYLTKFPSIKKGTEALLKHIRESLIATYSISRQDVLDVSKLTELKKGFLKNILGIVSKEVPTLSDEQQKLLAGTLIHEMLGLGEIEILIADDNLEEIVINNSKEPIWVYHKRLGWLKTDITVTDEEEIYNYSSKIGRGVGKDITTLNPLMDAHLMTGDRVNATLFPISTKGDTITIRKFRRTPWTIIELIRNSTISTDVAAFLWIAVEYEISIIISGGTASGKSSFLAALMPFIPPNQRVISIEETRELQLPKFLHWIPLSTRGANPEGKGEVTMLDLLINSLRMRPDRIIVGEVRRQKEAEVMFEAMHTGHSVYATVHADTAEQTTRRMTSPPINLPLEEIETLPLIVVMFRHRRKGIRRLFQVAEIISTNKEMNETQINVLFRWRPIEDVITTVADSVRIVNELRLHTGMDEDDLQKELKIRGQILTWMGERGVTGLNDVGKVISEFYFDRERVIKMAERNEPAETLLGARGGIKYKCPLCDEEFETALAMGRHKKNAHRGKPVRKKSIKKKAGLKKTVKKKKVKRRPKKKAVKKRAKTRAGRKR